MCHQGQKPYEEIGHFSNNFGVKGFAGVAEAVSSTDAEEDAAQVDEIRKLLDEMKKEEEKENQFENRELLDEIKKEEEKEKRFEIRELLDEIKKEETKEKKREKQFVLNWRNQLNSTRGMSQSRYHELRRRQVKIETEAWEEAAKEYRELLMDMCEQKLAPNLPYMKSLFLGWFEPLRDAIAKEQELYRTGKNRTAYAPYFVQLPADKMAVITMHKLMGLLMTGTDHGTARVLQAVISIGDAVEQEVGQSVFCICSCSFGF